MLFSCIFLYLVKVDTKWAVCYVAKWAIFCSCNNLLIFILFWFLSNFLRYFTILGYVMLPVTTLVGACKSAQWGWLQNIICQIFSKKIFRILSFIRLYCIFFWEKNLRKNIKSQNSPFFSKLCLLPLRTCSSMMPPAFVMPTKPNPMSVKYSVKKALPNILIFTILS